VIAPHSLLKIGTYFDALPLLSPERSLDRANRFRRAFFFLFPQNDWPPGLRTTAKADIVESRIA